MLSWCRAVALVFLGVALATTWSCYLDEGLPNPQKQRCQLQPSHPTCQAITTLDAGPLPDAPRQPPSDTTHKGQCGNGSCEPGLGESCASCAADCGCTFPQTCVQGACRFCGNARCEEQLGENCDSCPQDCLCPGGQVCRQGSCQSPVRCGDNSCDTSSGESCVTCPQDCPCKKGETCQNFQCKLAPGCGNTLCEAQLGENCSSCPQDCPCGAGRGCQGGRCQACLCSPGQKRCSSDGIQQCALHCMDWQSIETCSSSHGQICDPTSLACICDPKQACSPGAMRCDKSGHRQSCVQGPKCPQWQPNPCKPITPQHQMFCTQQGQCCECYPGERACHDYESYEICGSNCLWGRPYTCGPGEFCEGGRCVY